MKILNIYPNPGNDIVKIEYSNHVNIKPNQIIIIDQKGFVVSKTEIVNSSRNTIDLNVSKLTKGNYFVRLVSDDYYTNATKLIVE